MKCTNCGNELLNSNICSNCGHSNNIVNNTNYNNSFVSNSLLVDKSSVLAGFIGFFFSTAGVVLYFLLRRSKPLLAKSFKTGVIVNIVFATIFLLFYFIAIIIFTFALILFIIGTI